ncbi:MAG: protein N-terminal glutamine amidohydrolase [Gammaproteobacteria bacterium]|nr:protein N-terminal glutamine amidohydrolase [Gammaproteobacteria bacterium]
MHLRKLKREDFLYQPYYCEENIWHLCQHEQFKNSHVIVIASKGDSFPMLNQRDMENHLTPVLWDYHVILLAEEDTKQILDFDTSLPFNNDIETYFSNSFIDNDLLNADEKPLLRVMPASEYVMSFSSDRRHMKTESGWIAPPPVWPLIGNSVHNLPDFLDMSNNDIGDVLTIDEMLERFT